MASCHGKTIGIRDSDCPGKGVALPPDLAERFLDSRGLYGIILQIPGGKLLLCADCIHSHVQPFAARRKADIIRQLSTADYELTFCQQDFIEISPQFEHYYLCRCGRQFHYLLDQLSHIDQHLGDRQHGKDGELINGKRVMRDETVKGEPIIPVKKSMNVGIPDDFFD